MLPSGPPIRETVVEPETGKFFRPWLEWLQAIYALVVGRQGARTVISPPIGAGLRADVDVIWPRPYKDVNYTATATVEDTTAAGAGLRVERIRARTAQKITVQVINDSAGPLAGTVHGLAIHDA